MTNRQLALILFQAQSCNQMNYKCWKEVYVELKAELQSKIELDSSLSLHTNTLSHRYANIYRVSNLCQSSFCSLTRS